MKPRLAPVAAAHSQSTGRFEVEDFAKTRTAFQAAAASDGQGETITCELFNDEAA